MKHIMIRFVIGRLTSFREGEASPSSN